MAQMSFRINDSVKKDFEKICEELGLNPTTALTIFIKKCVENAEYLLMFPYITVILLRFLMKQQTIRISANLCHNVK